MIKNISKKQIFPTVSFLNLMPIRNIPKLRIHLTARHPRWDPIGLFIVIAIGGDFYPIAIHITDAYIPARRFASYDFTCLWAVAEGDVFCVR